VVVHSIRELEDMEGKRVDRRQLLVPQRQEKGKLRLKGGSVT